MSIRCAFGFHAWRGRATARPGTTVYRCGACDRRLVLHGGKSRTRKRVFLVAAFAVSAAIWFVGYNLVANGRTGVLSTSKRVVNKVDRTAGAVRATIHRVEGDSGTYVEGNAPAR